MHLKKIGLLIFSLLVFYFGHGLKLNSPGGQKIEPRPDQVAEVIKEAPNPEKDAGPPRAGSGSALRFQNLKKRIREQIVGRKMPQDLRELQRQLVEAYERLPQAERTEDAKMLRKLCDRKAYLACESLFNVLNMALMKEAESSQSWSAISDGNAELRELAVVTCLETGAHCFHAHRMNRDSEIGRLILPLTEHYCNEDPHYCDDFAANFGNERRERSLASIDDDPEASKKMLWAVDRSCGSGSWDSCRTVIALADADDPSIQRAQQLFDQACDAEDVSACADSAAIRLKSGEWEEAAVYAATACQNNQGTGCLVEAAVALEQTGDYESLRPALNRLCSNQLMGPNRTLCRDLQDSVITEEFLKTHDYYAANASHSTFGNLWHYFRRTSSALSN